jgi:predicted phosphoribosyltransferase
MSPVDSSEHLRFRTRSEAGQLLASSLLKYAGQPGVVVLGLSPAGVTVAAEVARRLAAPLDVLIVRRLAIPCREELTMGAIAPGGVCVLNDALLDRLDIEGDAIGAVRLHEVHELNRCEELYRENRPPLEVRGRTVILVDDGIALSWPAHAAIVFLHQRDAARVVVAAPVVARDALGDLNRLAAEVVALVEPEATQTLGEWYEDFSTPADDYIRRQLGYRDAPAAAPRSGPPKTRPAE